MPSDRGSSRQLFSPLFRRVHIAPIEHIQPIEPMNIPAELQYTKDHEWIRVEGDEAVVGITDFAQGELGDIVFVDIGSEGQEVDRHAVFGTVEAVKTVSDLF